MTECRLARLGTEVRDDPAQQRCRAVRHLDQRADGESPSLTNATQWFAMHIVAGEYFGEQVVAEPRLGQHARSLRLKMLLRVRAGLALQAIDSGFD